MYMCICTLYVEFLASKNHRVHNVYSESLYQNTCTYKCRKMIFIKGGVCICTIFHLLFIEQLHDLVSVLIDGHMASVDSQHFQEAQASGLLHTVSSITAATKCTPITLHVI